MRLEAVGRLPKSEDVVVLPGARHMGVDLHEWRWRLSMDRVAGRILEGAAGDLLLGAAIRLVYRRAPRRALLGVAEALMRARLRATHDGGSAGRLLAEKTAFGRAVLATTERALEAGAIAPSFMNASGRLWARSLLPGRERREKAGAFAGRFGFEPPWLIAVSPGHGCNLRCPGCYSGSSDGDSKLDWRTFDRVVGEARELWGVRLVVLSGGEPMAYRSNGLGVLDMAERHPDCMFLMFSNGTLIGDREARRLARAGNMTVAVSVEGMRTSTDARRGGGAFDDALRAIRCLRKAGVLFGISATATRHNCEELLSDRFLDFFFGEEGAYYAFLFQYMPNGRDPDVSLMPDPAQRMRMWERTWRAVAGKGYFIFDFWNHGTLVNGCVSAGRERGYLHVDWAGRVTPCVFAPYSAVNVHDVFAGGGDLNDVMDAPFFRAIRRWQREYGYGAAGPAGEWLRPCPVRDHYSTFSRWLTEYGPEPEDEAACRALTDEGYRRGLISYGRELAELSRPVWESVYLATEEDGCATVSRSAALSVGPAPRLSRQRARTWKRWRRSPPGGAPRRAAR